MRRRPGDEGGPYGCDIICLSGGPTPGKGDTGRIVFTTVFGAVEGEGIGAASSRFFLAFSSSFFLLKFQNLLFPDFELEAEGSFSSLALFIPSPSSGTDEVRDPESSALSLLKLALLSAILPNSFARGYLATMDIYRSQGKDLSNDSDSALQKVAIQGLRLHAARVIAESIRTANDASVEAHL